ncbi:MAG: caspase family protein [Muribaculaceae bacterium]|nr:caspase family protein [Muribaculaceae bacterium]
MIRVLFIYFILFLFSPLHAETYVVCVGIGNYTDPKVPNLEKTEKDAISVAEFYKKGTPNVITITRRYATKAQILNSLRSQFGRAMKDDKIVFYFSGHGYPGGFCPYDMHSVKDGLAYSEVIEVMAKSKAKDKMIFADACNSGAIRQSKSSPNPDPGNILLFLSSRGNESSIESSLISNGFFTHYLLNGLGGKADANADRSITAKELYEYVSQGVIQLSKNAQHPVIWGKFPDNLVIVKYRKR